MMRHLYGTPRGLPLDILSRSFWAGRWSAELTWLQKATPKILNCGGGGQLMLLITHTLEGRAGRMRRYLNSHRHYICMHVTTEPTVRDSIRSHLDPQTIPVLDEPLPHEKDKGFRACRDVIDSCPVCSTDYDTTIERCEVREASTLGTSGEVSELSHRSYHLVATRVKGIREKEY